MASLTPGVLSKLLENVDNAEVRVAGEHRTALLQVIGILPSLGAGDDLWQSRGFFLRVSDSVHSAYVSISDSDSDLILSDKIQLGQFIHVTRLDSGSPVPVLRGVKVVPKRRPCVGNPTDLISSESLAIRTRVEFSRKGARVKRVDLKMKSNNNNSNKRLVRDEIDKQRRVSLGNGKIEGLELRRLSLDSARKGWDRSPGAKNGFRSVSRFKSRRETSSSSDSASVLSGRKESSEKDLAPRRASLCISPLKIKNGIDSQKLISKPLRKDLKSSFDGTIPSHLIKVPLSSKTWSDRKILWESLPLSIHDLGKDVMCQRNVAFFAAVHALEEATATEEIIRCMSLFAELCESAQKDPAGPLVELFLNLHQSMQKAATTVDALISTRFSETKNNSSSLSQLPPPEAGKDIINKNAKSWVQAAIQTDLSNFVLFTKEEKNDILNSKKCNYVVLENTNDKVESENHSPPKRRTLKNHVGPIADRRAKGSSLPSHSRRQISTKKKIGIETEEWSKVSSLKEAASLAEKLLLVSREWFLNYLEVSLNNGFGLSKGEKSSEVAGLLGLLKRVNQWLDCSVGNEDGVDERIERLKKKLYVFLLENVDSAVVASR